MVEEAGVEIVDGLQLACPGLGRAVSWPWVPALGSLEPPRRDGENAQRTGKNGEKMGEIRSKRCEGVGITWSAASRAAVELTGIANGSLGPGPPPGGLVPTVVPTRPKSVTANRRVGGQTSRRTSTQRTDGSAGLTKQSSGTVGPRPLLTLAV